MFGYDRMQWFELITSSVEGEEKKDMRAYLDELASASPTPGGGSAAAVAGSMGAALVVMVCQVTLAKDVYQAVSAELLAVQDEAEALKDILLDLAAQDAAAYNRVVSAYRLPKASDSEKALRRQAIQSALRHATEVPLETARACRDVLDLACPIADKINPNTLSDLATAAALAEAGLQGARLNVIINAGSIEDTVFSEAVVSQVGSLAVTAGELREAVLGYCAETLV